MGVRCLVFIDGGMIGEPYRFASVPRVGDSIQIAKTGNHMMLTVDRVLHVAEGTFENMSEGGVQLHVSTKSSPNA